MTEWLRSSSIIHHLVKPYKQRVYSYVVLKVVNFYTALKDEEDNW